MFPDSSDWYARNPSGTRKNTARNASPGASSTYGIKPRWRWNHFISAGDQVLPLRQVLLVVQRVAVEEVDLRQRLRRREDELVVRHGRIQLQRRLLRPDDGRDVVDAGDVLLRV